MTSLQITPNWKNKTAKFKGTIAAGEHVAVSIANDDNYITDAANLRLRVVNPTNGKTLAQFPMPEEDGEEEVLPSSETPAEGEVAWASDLTPLFCILNLNTDRMLMAVPPEANVQLLFVLDDYEGKTLYFKDYCDVTHWPRRVGEEEPVNHLDDYRDLIEDFRERIDAAENSIRDAVDEANGIVAHVDAAKTDAQNSATEAGNSASAAQTSAATAKNWATSAAGSATAAEQWATGGTGGTPSATNNAKYYAEQAEETFGSKADKVKSATSGNFAGLDANGNLTDSGKKAGDFAPATNIAKSALASDVQTSLGKADTAVQSGDILSDGKIKSDLLPSYVDDVLEYASIANFPSPGETGKIYVAKDENKTYRWDGSQYVQIGGSSVDPTLYYPEGNVRSAAEFTAGIKYNAPDTTNRTITVKPFCNTGDSTNDNSELVGRVVIPPFVDGDGNGYISDDGTRYRVVGVSVIGFSPYSATNLTSIIAPSTVTTIEDYAFHDCVSLTSVSLPAVTTIGQNAFYACISLTSVSLPAATSIGESAFRDCVSLTSVSLPAATSIGESAFVSCSELASVDFGDTPRPSVPTLGEHAFDSTPPFCKIIVPDSQYDAWTAETLPGGSSNPWHTLVAAGYSFLRHSKWEYARRYEIPDTSTLAPLASPAFTGAPTAPTQAASDNSTNIATTAFVKTAVAGITITPLSGQIFNFATMAGMYRAVSALVDALGGTVTNNPTATP